jgi:hypothetical protein
MLGKFTLAGAADVILSQLLLNNGKENFSDELMRVDAAATGVMPERAAHGRAINGMLMINALKHMDPDDKYYIDMDVRVSALATVSKALANYYSLVGPAVADRTDFTEAFRLWARIFTPRGLNEDGTPRAPE